MWHGPYPRIWPMGLAWRHQQLHLSLSSSWAHSCLCQRHSLMESRISWKNFSPISASQGLLPGSLHSWYMSLYTSLISSLVDPGPMSSTAEYSASRSHSGKGCHQPWQMAWACSSCPVAAACKNILYKRNGKWNLWGSHCGYSSRKASALSCLSASHMEMPVSCASFIAAVVLQFDSHTSNWLRNHN